MSTRIKFEVGDTAYYKRRHGYAILKGVITELTTATTGWAGKQVPAVRFLADITQPGSPDAAANGYIVENTRTKILDETEGGEAYRRWKVGQDEAAQRKEDARKEEADFRASADGKRVMRLYQNAGLRIVLGDMMRLAPALADMFGPAEEAWLSADEEANDA